MNIENIIGYIFKDRDILNEILHSQNSKLYERYEFLGDSIINLQITQYIYSHFKSKRVGFLSKIRSYLISKELQVNISRRFNLDRYVHDKSNKNISNFIESLIGGVYLDCYDYKLTNKIVMLLWKEFLHTYNIKSIDTKGDLQVFCHKNNLPMPIYNHIQSENNSKVSILVGNHYMETIAKNKKIGEKKLANDMLVFFKNK